MAEIDQISSISCLLNTEKEEEKCNISQMEPFCTIGDGECNLHFTSCDHYVSRIACHGDYCCCCYRRRLYSVCVIGVSLPGPFPSSGAAGDAVPFRDMSGAVAPNAMGEEKVPGDPIPTLSGNR